MKKTLKNPYDIIVQLFPLEIPTLEQNFLNSDYKILLLDVPPTIFSLVYILAESTVERATPSFKCDLYLGSFECESPEKGMKQAQIHLYSCCTVFAMNCSTALVCRRSRKTEIICQTVVKQLSFLNTKTFVPKSVCAQRLRMQIKLVKTFRSLDLDKATQITE